MRLAVGCVLCVWFGLTGCGGDAAALGAVEPMHAPARSTPTIIGAGAELGPAPRHFAEDLLRLNQLQLTATHNSYHQYPPLAFHASHRYELPPLQVQLETHGVRGFELDVHLDENGALSVYHIRALDQRSSCTTLDACLTTLRRWSDAHRRHVPLVVWIEVKDATGGRSISDLSVVDAAIRKVFDDAHLITPDFVQAGHASPRARVQAAGWPTLGETRGRVMFVLLNPDRAAQYTDGLRSLAGKPMFAVAAPDQYALPWALVTKHDDPRDRAPIRKAIAAGLLVASNGCLAGLSTRECLLRRRAGLVGGVHTLHEDFLTDASVLARPASPAQGSIAARCNPVTAPRVCEARAE